MLSQMATTSLELEEVGVGYGRLEILRGVNLRAARGELIALIGPNGVGKTTLLRTIAGQLPLLHGDIRFDGTSLRGRPSARNRAGVCLIPQDVCIFRSLKVRDNLSFGTAGIEQALEVFPELEPHLPRLAGLLSGGQQRMVALARAIASAPVLLLADELTIGLSPSTTQRLLDALRQYADCGHAAVLVEQHVEQALGIADRGYVIGHTGIEMAGSAEELRRSIDDVKAIYFAGHKQRRSAAVVERSRADRQATNMNQPRRNELGTSKNRGDGARQTHRTTKSPTSEEQR